MNNIRPITLCNRPFALESVSRCETAVQGQTAVTHVRYELADLCEDFNCYRQSQYMIPVGRMELF
jgi:hypothetical protein